MTDRIKTVTDSKIQTICKYIEEHLQEELTHDHLIKQLGIQRHVLVTIFPQWTGVTVTSYIIEMRLRTAVALVKSGTRIETAASQAGFRTYSHFYKMFVKHLGVSPRAYFTLERRE